MIAWSLVSVRKQGVTASGEWLSLGRSMKLPHMGTVVTVAQFHDYSKKHWVIYFI